MKIGGNVEFSTLTIPVYYCKFRRLGNSEVLSSNPWAAGSNPAPAKRDYRSISKNISMRIGRTAKKEAGDG